MEGLDRLFEAASRGPDVTLTLEDCALVMDLIREVKRLRERLASIAREAGKGAQ